jgi:glutathione synthase
MNPSSRFILDPLEGLKAYKDSSSVAMMRRDAARRGHEVWAMQRAGADLARRRGGARGRGAWTVRAVTTPKDWFDGRAPLRTRRSRWPPSTPC